MNIFLSRNEHQLKIRMLVKMRQLLKPFFIIGVLLLNVAILLAQSNQTIIEGTILDTEGKPIPYATVAIANTSIGTVSNDKGFFSLITNGDKTTQLIVRCIGYEESEKTIQFGIKKYLKSEIVKPIFAKFN